MNRCIACYQPAPHFMCDSCKEARRRLRDIRQEQYAGSCEADDEARALRVELYAAVVERGGRIFEPGSRSA